ncbi:MAG: TetR family transcriptional regulator [Nakamurella sp.]
MELYAANGYEATTVADIAGRAGLTERTFFRYFPDKREVLFDGAQQLQDLFVSTVAAHPPGRAALNAVHAAVTAAAQVMQPGREQASRRAVVIASDSVLRER